MEQHTKYGIAIAISIAAMLLFGAALFFGPQYKVYMYTLRGKAKYQEAEYTRRIAEHEAAAEVVRAQGVAEANKIIGESLQNNEAYLRYLWINGLHDGTSEVIYIPTEANLPILEARDER